MFFSFLFSSNLPFYHSHEVNSRTKGRVNPQEQRGWGRGRSPGRVGVMGEGEVPREGGVMQRGLTSDTEGPEWSSAQYRASLVKR